MGESSRRITAWNVIGVFLVAMAVAVLTACGGGGGSGDALATTEALVTTGLESPQSLQARAPRVRAASLAGQATLVNATTAGQQTVQAVGSLADGGYAVAWLSQSDPAAAAMPTLYLQRYDALGMKLGAETPIRFDFASANVTAGSTPAVAVLADGSVLVAYASNRFVSSSATAYFESSGIYSQRFDSSGAPASGETTVFTLVRQLVNAQQLDSVASPVVLSWADGSYLVGWSLQHDLGHLGTFSDFQSQRFDPQGAPAGSVVSFSGGGDPCASFSLTAIRDGGYVVERTYCSMGSTNVIFTVVDGTTHSGQIGTLAGANDLPATTRVVALTGAGYALWSRDSSGLYVQMLDSAGNPVGARSPVASLPSSLIALTDGGYVALWTASGSAALAQEFDNTGAAVGEPIEIAAGGVVPLAISLIDGDLALAWTALSASGDEDVMTQLVGPSQSNALAQQATRRACLFEARGMTGQPRRVFMAACLIR